MLEEPLLQLKGKIMLVGTEPPKPPVILRRRPFRTFPFVNPKLLIHANILDSIIHDDGIMVAPRWVNWLSPHCSPAGFVLWWCSIRRRFTAWCFRPWAGDAARRGSRLHRPLQGTLIRKASRSSPWRSPTGCPIA